MNDDSTEYWLNWYRQCYKLMHPSQESVNLASDLWQKWESDPTQRPDVHNISTRVGEIERGFFSELLSVARNLHGTRMNVEYCPFVTSSYNLAAKTTSDGYIVLVDDAFLQLLFLLSNVLVHTAYTEFESATLEALKVEINDCLYRGYVRRLSYNVPDQSVMAHLMGGNYENTEAGGFLFQAIKAFMLGHELGHHALKHSAQSIQKNCLANENTPTYEFDKNQWHEEFAADAFGYRVLARMLEGGPEIDPLHHFVYSFPFAPLLLFDICSRLEHKASQFRGTTFMDGAGYTHPPLAQRRKALISTFQINESDNLYGYMREALDELLPL